MYCCAQREGSRGIHINIFTLCKIVVRCRKRPISGTGRRSSEHQAFNDLNGGDVVPVGSGDGDSVKCSTSWNSDDEDSDCTESRSSSGDVVQRSRSNADETRTMTARLENIVVVNARDHDVDDDDVQYWTSSSSSPLSVSTRHNYWSGRRSTLAVVRPLPVPTRGIAVRTQAPSYRLNTRPNTTPWRRGAVGRLTTLPSAAVRRRPGSVNGSSLGLNIGLIVGIAAGVVVLFLVLGYAVNRYRRFRGGADCGSYRLDRATVGVDSCCRHDGLKLLPSQPPPPLGLQSAPRGCYGSSATTLGKAGTSKLPSKEWYV